MQAYSEQISPQRRMIIRIPDNPAPAMDVLQLIRDHFNMRQSQPASAESPAVPTTRMDTDTAEEDDQWNVLTQNEHIYSRYTNSTPPPLVKVTDEPAHLRNPMLFQLHTLQDLQVLNRQNNMRERLLNMIGAQRELLTQRRNELQSLQQAAADLIRSSASREESAPRLRVTSGVRMSIEPSASYQDSQVLAGLSRMDIIPLSPPLSRHGSQSTLASLGVAEVPSIDIVSSNDPLGTHFWQWRQRASEAQ